MNVKVLNITDRDTMEYPDREFDDEILNEVFYLGLNIRMRLYDANYECALSTSSVKNVYIEHNSIIVYTANTIYDMEFV